MSRLSILLIAIVGGLGLFAGMGSIQARAQPDSVRAAILEEKGFSPTHSPTGALWRAAAVPGWGQLYNRQYYKIPFVYAGFGALGYRAYQAHDQYQLFRRAALFKNEQNPRTEFRPQYIEALKEATGCQNEEECLSTPLSARQLRQQRDNLRRRRNLAIIGTGVFYALTVLDAYVSAHLLTFDVGDDLDVRVTPGATTGRAWRPPNRGRVTHRPEIGMRPGTDGVGLGLQVRF